MICKSPAPCGAGNRASVQAGWHGLPVRFLPGADFDLKDVQGLVAIFVYEFHLIGAVSGYMSGNIGNYRLNVLVGLYAIEVGGLQIF